MDLDTARRVNLLECLAEDHPEVPPPPEDAAGAWSEARIRQYYASGGRSVSQLALNDDGVSGPATAPPSDEASVPSPGGLEAAQRARDARSQPGGGVAQTEHPELDPKNAPAALTRHQRAATMKGYREAAISDGIPFR